MATENELVWQNGLPYGKSSLDLAREIAGVSGLQTRRFRYREIGDDGLVEIGVHMGKGVVEAVGQVKINFEELEEQAKKTGGYATIVWQDSKTGAPQSSTFDIL